MSRKKNPCFNVLQEATSGLIDCAAKARRNRVASGEETRGEPQVLVVGASGVLGSAITRRLCEDWGDSQVLGTYFSNPQRVRELGCVSTYLDARDKDAIEQLMAQTRPRALALCEGVGGGALVVKMSATQWRTEMSEPLESLFWTLRAALKYLPDNARVVWLGSRVGEVGGTGQSAYAASKAAGESLVKAAAIEGAARGLAFNVVCPGFVVSPLTRGLSEARLERERARDVGGALGSEQACASLVAWILSASSAGISGQVLHADGRVG